MVGETSQAILHVEYLTEMPKEAPITETLNSFALRHKLRYSSVFYSVNSAKNRNQRGYDPLYYTF